MEHIQAFETFHKILILSIFKRLRVVSYQENKISTEIRTTFKNKYKEILYFKNIILEMTILVDNFYLFEMTT